MSAQQRMRVANEKASKNITNRGNVIKAVVSEIWRILTLMASCKLEYFDEEGVQIISIDLEAVNSNYSILSAD